MIALMYDIPDKNKHTFGIKLTPPDPDTDPYDQPDSRVRTLNFAPAVFAALGYTLTKKGCRSLKPDRFKDGPLYYDIVLSKDRMQILEVYRRRMTAEGTIERVIQT